MDARLSTIATRKKRLLAGTAILGLFMLAGCTATPKATDAASPPAPASSSPSIAPVTPSATKPALDTLTVSPQGIDTILVGSPVPAEPSSTAIVAYAPHYCPMWGSVGQPGVGIWLPNYPKSSDLLADGPDSFTVHTKGRVKNGVVTDLWVWSSKIKTQAGIHIGSTLAEVQAAYPQPSSLIHADVTDIYVIDKGTGRMVIEVGRVADGELTKADIGKVLYIGVEPKSAKVRSIANVDGTAGCGE